MPLFNNKYRIESARLPSWNYGDNAPYFVTICTGNGEHFFGRILNDRMQLSELGTAAEKCWKAIPEHFPFVKLGVHVVMPNHVHGIIIIDKQTLSALVTQDLASLHNTEPTNHESTNELFNKSPFLKNNKHRRNDQAKPHNVVPFKPLFEDDHRKDHKNNERNRLLYGLQLHEAKWPSIFVKTYPVSRHLEKIFEKSHPPTDQYNRKQPKVLAP